MAVVDFDSMTAAERTAHQAEAERLRAQMTREAMEIEDGPDEVFASAEQADEAIRAAQALRRQSAKALRELLADTAFQRQVKTARTHIVIQRYTCIEEARQPRVIFTPQSLHGGTGMPRFRSLPADHWDIPEGHVNGSALGGAHQRPVGPILARVELDFTVTLL